jgi:hypothetical protein
MTTSPLAEIVHAIRYQPEITAQNWTELGADRVLPTMDGEFLRSVTENHVDALAFDALRLLGWDTRVSPYIIAILKRRTALNEAVYEAHYDALVELVGLAGPIVANAMIPKGALLGPLYPSLGHRRMTDFDLLVPADVHDGLLAALASLGYQEEQGGFGRDLVKRIGPLWSWRDRVTMHVFIRNPSYDRFLQTGSVRDVPCLLPSPELHLTSLLMNAQEHAASFTFASFGSDLQYIRTIDVELIADTYQVDPLELWRVATALSVQTEVAIGLHVQRRLRNSLPKGWEVLDPVLAAVDPVADLVATPYGEIVTWPLTGQDRVFHPNRTATALELLPEQLRTTEYLTSLRRSLFQESEPADKILDLVRSDVLTAARQLADGH